MPNKLLYINTMGCQMNVYDSRQIENRLAPAGYTTTEDLTRADVIIVNTCSIRAKAEQKAFSFLGRLSPLKELNPQLIIGIGGCVAQNLGEAVFRRMPYVDLVFGTQAIPRLPLILKRITATRRRIVDIEMTEKITSQDFTVDTISHGEVSAFVTIMRGCDNFCAYCVVPFVRGREASRTEEEIVSEIRHLVSGGVREVTLLGQNVNSYGQKEGRADFVHLLKEINYIDGLERIRFTTSHPKDLSKELIQAFTHLDKLCRHIHLPVQSGSNAVLSRMNRRYTCQDYLSKVTQLRRACPGIAITSDIIVGFPGETDEDFLQTMDMIKQVHFDNLFAFIYSDRPNAPAVRFSGKVADTVKKERLQAVLDLQNKITIEKNQDLVGSIQEILVDGPSKNRSSVFSGPEKIDCPTPQQWSGRTATNKIVHFSHKSIDAFPNQALTGRLMDIMIEEVMSHSLWGVPVRPFEGSLGKGVI